MCFYCATSSCRKRWACGEQRTESAAGYGHSMILVNSNDNCVPTSAAMLLRLIWIRLRGWSWPACRVRVCCVAAALTTAKPPRITPLPFWDDCTTHSHRISDDTLVAPLLRTNFDVTSTCCMLGSRSATYTVCIQALQGLLNVPCLFLDWRLLARLFAFGSCSRSPVRVLCSSKLDELRWRQSPFNATCQLRSPSVRLLSSLSLRHFRRDLGVRRPID